MYTVRIHSQLEDRLDAEFYNPIALKTVQKIDALGKTKRLGQLIADGYRVVYHGTDSINGIADEKLLPFLSPTQIDDQGSIDFSAVDKLPLYYKEDYPKGLASAGELLIEVKGNVSKVGVVPEVFPKNLMISGSLYKASFNTDTNSRYVLAFLKSGHGQILKNRLTSNTIINYIAKDALYSIPLFVPNGDAQKYIGDKVRQAERLRAWAKKLESEFNSSLKKAVPEAFENKSTGRKYSKALAQEITYTLNPGAFDEERLRVQRYLLSLGGQRFRMLAEIIGPTTNSYKPGDTYIGLDAIASGNSQLSPSTVEQAEIAGTCRRLTEGPIIAKLRPYLNKVSYIPKRLAGAVGSTELLCVSPIGSNSGWYIYGILKSELTLKQLRPLATGATHPRIDQYDVYDLVFPVLDNQESLGHLLEQAQEAYFLSTELTSAAKFLVEALIEGQLSEADLIAAEQALQAGKDQPDRQTLNRLKTDGIDGQGQALFSDLDQLYSLLEQSDHS